MQKTIEKLKKYNVDVKINITGIYIKRPDREKFFRISSKHQNKKALKLILDYFVECEKLGVNALQ